MIGATHVGGVRFNLKPNNIIHIHMKNLFTLAAVAAGLVLTSCQAPKKDCATCSSCDKKPAAAACCKDGSCAKCKAKK